MCGLTGFAGFAGAPPAGTAGSSLREMTETRVCRGPAGWAEGPVGAGHTRPAIVDPADGRQPLVLERGGRTEPVVVHSVATRGERAPSRLEGRFGCAAWQPARVPFLGTRLVAYVLNSPWRFETFDGHEKSLLPESVPARRKSPYPLVHDPGYRAILTARAARATQVLAVADLLGGRAVRALLLEAGGEDRFPREGPEFVLELNLDRRPRTHRLAPKL